MTKSLLGALFAACLFASPVLAQDVRITDLPSAGTLTGTESIPVVSGGALKKTTTDALAARAGVIAAPASTILDLLGSTRGSVLYRGASGWAALSPGTSGYALKSQGAGADPAWGAISPGGSSGQLQFNSSGAFAGVTGSSVDGSGNVTLGSALTLTGNSTAANFVFSGSNGGLYVPGGANFLLLSSSLSTLGASSFALGSLGDTILTRDAANTLALRNGANAQTFNVYRSFTDGANYERAVVGNLGTFAGYSNRIGLLTESGGTGGGLNIDLGTRGPGAIYLATNNVFRWSIDSSGNFSSFADNTYDIGASGANRPRNVYVAGSGIFGGDARVGVGGQVMFGGTAQTRLYAPTDGQLVLWNSTQSNFSQLIFGGTSSSFPALKRSGTALQVRLADDSGDAPFSASAFTAAGSAGVTCSGTPTSSFASVGGIVTHC